MLDNMIKFLLIPILILVGLFLILVLITGAMEILRVFGVRSIQYRRYFSREGVFEGDSLEMIEEVTNRAWFPMVRVDIESYVTSAIDMAGCDAKNEIMQHFFSRFGLIMPSTTIRRSHPCRALKRGYYRLESAKMMFADYDLFLESEAELYVYPRELRLQEEETYSRILQYHTQSRIPIIPDRFSFAGVREYRTSDAMSSVNFKATARYGKLMVNDTEYVLGRQIKIYINFHSGKDYVSMEDFAKRMEQALNYTAYAFSRALSEGSRFGFGANCHMSDGAYFTNIPLGSGDVHYIEALKELAKVHTYEGNSFISVIDLDLRQFMSSAEVYILTAYVDEGIESRIERLERLGNIVRVVKV